MTVIIAMLRGVNVGGHNQIRMDALRALFEAMGMGDVQTYVQSGNVVFRTSERNLDALRRKIEAEIERRHGFRVDVILLTAAKLKKTIANNPFADRKEIEHSKLLVTFLAATPSPDAKKKALALQADAEELRILDCELYMYFPNGMASPKLPWMTVVKALGTTGTGRNWNSVLKLFEMAAKLEDSK